jgi:hypothetical protein
MAIKDMLLGTPAETFRLKEVRPDSYQLIAPIFHEDGDMLSIFLEYCEGGVKITDHGMSLMRLSYLFDIDTDNKRRVLNDIVLARKAEIRQGRIESVVQSNDLFPYIMNYAQLIAEVCSMDVMSRETVASMFYDYLREAIENLGISARCISDYQPKGFPQVNVDYAFFRDEAKQPVYLFGVKDTNKAQQTTISCLQMEIKSAPGRTVAVFDDVDGLTRKARINILNTVGKTFDLDGFREKGRQYIETELGVA